MNWKAVSVVVVLGALAWSRPADAEKVRTNQTTKLYSRAGEQSPVILKLKAGQTMTVLAKDGRWVKVRVSGRTGWIPRSKVDMSDDEELARNTRRRPFVDGRSTKRGFGGTGGPDDRIGADATGEGADAEDEKPAKTASRDDGDEDRGSRRKKPSEDDGDDEGKSSKGKGKSSDDGDEVEVEDSKEAVRPMAHVAKATPVYNDPDSTSDASFTAQPRTALYVLEEKGKWTFVENDEGDAGYVLTSKLDIERASPSGPRTRALDLRARLGLAQVNQSVSTPGGTAPVPDNYTAGSSAVTLALGAAYLRPLSTRYWIGGEFAYDYNRTLFGGIEHTVMATKTTTGFTFHNLNLRALGGYDLQNARGMIAFARLGYHYDSFQVSDVGDFTKNSARIPNQIIQGPTLGAALAIARLTDKIGIKASLDFMLIGSSVQQTKNLEDGINPSAKAVYFGSGLTYRFKPKIDLQGALDVGYTSLSFGGPPPATSMRGHVPGTAASSASDFNVTASFGVAYAL